MPKEKETQDQKICTQHVLVGGYTGVHRPSGPRIEISTQLRIVFDKQNRDRNDHVGTSFHQSSDRFFAIPFRKNDERHDRKTKNFHPPLESDERKVRPNNVNKAINEEARQHALVPGYFSNIAF